MRQRDVLLWLGCDLLRFLSCSLLLLLLLLLLLVVVVVVMTMMMMMMRVVMGFSYEDECLALDLPLSGELTGTLRGATVKGSLLADRYV